MGTTDGRVALSWTTASETNNAGFRIQRKPLTSTGGVKASRTTGMTSGPRDAATGATKKDGGSWTTVGSVEGSGTTTEAQRYRFTDADLPYEADGKTRTQKLTVVRSPIWLVSFGK